MPSPVERIGTFPGDTVAGFTVVYQTTGNHSAKPAMPSPVERTSPFPGDTVAGFTVVCPGYRSRHLD